MAKVSERKIAANRSNAKKSNGPKTLRGRNISSRNAWRHGMTAPAEYSAVEEQEIEKLAWALCEGVSPDKELIAKARVLAEETAYHARLTKLRLRRLDELLDAARLDTRVWDEVSLPEETGAMGSDAELLARVFMSTHRQQVLDDLYLNRSARRMKRALEAFRRSYGELAFARYEESVACRAFEAVLAQGLDCRSGKPKKIRAPRRPPLSMPKMPTATGK